MANKTSKASRTSSKKATTTSRWSQFGQRQATIAAAFVLVFAGLGTYAINASHAASRWICVSHQYYLGEPGIYKGYCVYQLQEALIEMQWLNVYNSVPYNGVFGATTKAAVIKLQKYYHLSPDGVVGKNTWPKICVNIPDYNGHTPNQVYYNLGCDTGKYGNVPV